MADLNPFSIMNFFGESVKNWILPIVIIVVLLIILFIIKAIQKRASERNLNLLRRG